MDKNFAKKISNEILYGNFTCPYCNRKVPNYTFLTKNQCIWCDIKYWLRKQKLALRK
jgi:hypothetical protein